MGKAYFNVEDIYGNRHREVETIREMDNTVLVFDIDDHETYTIRKEDVGMKLNRPAIRREKFNLSQNKRIWRNHQFVIFNDKDNYENSKDIVGIIGVIVVSVAFLLLFLGK